MPIELMQYADGLWTNRWTHEPECEWCPHKSSYKFRTRRQAERIGQKDILANTQGDWNRA